VGHTGQLEASILAMECVDLQLGRLMRCIAQLGGALIVTADHGNCDEMFERNKAGETKLDTAGNPQPKTSHSLNPVPFYVYAPGAKLALARSRRVGEPGLSNLAGTVLELLGFATPEGYDPSLLGG
jgi:2,3-bisphosphoglycerate-independent phosphoglycerate mutase